MACYVCLFHVLPTQSKTAVVAISCFFVGSNLIGISTETSKLLVFKGELAKYDVSEQHVITCAMGVELIISLHIVKGK